MVWRSLGLMKIIKVPRNLPPSSVGLSQRAHSLTWIKKKEFRKSRRQAAYLGFSSQSSRCSLRSSGSAENECQMSIKVSSAYTYFGTFVAFKLSIILKYFPENRDFSDTKIRWFCPRRIWSLRQVLSRLCLHTPYPLRWFITSALCSQSPYIAVN